MKIAKRDWIFIAVIVALLGALLINTGKTKTKNVPFDDKHSRFYDLMQKGGERVSVEKECTACHGSKALPLPQAHPPKEQCLICHKLSQGKR